MKLKYNVEDRLPASQLILYSVQWFVLAVAVAITVTIAVCALAMCNAVENDTHVVELLVDV